jgi:hypothetical protein
MTIIVRFSLICMLDPKWNSFVRLVQSVGTKLEMLTLFRIFFFLCFCLKNEEKRTALGKVKLLLSHKCDLVLYSSSIAHKI